jgi:rhamnosyl/mannosyltransferase
MRQVCLAVKPHGIHNTIFTLSPSPVPATIASSEADVVRARSWAAPASCDLGGPAAFATFRSLAREADLIHYFFPWPFADLLHRTLPAHTPAVMTYVSDIVRQKYLGRIYAPLMQRTLAQMRGIAVSSPAYARTSPVLQQEHVRHKVEVVPFGIAEPAQPPMSDLTVFKRLDLCADTPYVFFLGVLRYYKGLHVLIKAAAAIKVPIVIAGSGPEEQNLRTLVTEQGVSNVIFAGQVSDAEKNALMQHCYTFVLPSHLRSEAYGMVLIEAAMRSRPLVSCEIGTGTSFINQHGHTGLVVPPESPAALSEAVNALLHDPARAQKMGQGARRRYEKHFSVSALGRNYADFFTRAVQ